MTESPEWGRKGKKIALGSASSWTPVEPGKFHVDFDLITYSLLPDSVLLFDPGSLDLSMASSTPESDLEQSK